jgi:hypothetical protein
VSAPVTAEVNTGQWDNALAGLLADIKLATGPLGAIGTIALAAARQGAPVRSGRMRANHSAGPARGGKVRITVSTPYAAPIHWGSPRQGFRRQPWVVATFNRDESTWKTTAIDRMQADIDKAAAKT